MEIPEHLELDVSGMAIGDTLRLADLPPREGVTYLDDPEETVLATVTLPTRVEEPGGPRRARSCRGRGARGRGAAEAPPRRRGCGRASPASPAPPRLACACLGAGASAPRRSTCSSSGSAIPAASTRAHRHNVGWMVVDELARRHGGSWRAKFSGQLAELRLDGHRVALLKPETYMNESGRSVARRGALLQARAGRDARRPRRGRSRARPAAGAPGGGLAGPQRAALDRAAPRHAGVPPPAGRRRPSGPRRSAPARRLRALGFEPEDDAETLVGRAADAVETLDAEGLDARRQFN